MIKCAELLDREIGVDFIDINMGCPIDLVYKQVNYHLYLFLTNLNFLCFWNSD